MKAVIYARYSSSMQREESIEAQVRACADYISNQKGWVLTSQYVDRAFSARSDQRPEFQRMINDAKLKKFDAIVIHKLDRFSRDRYDHAIYKRELRQAGVTLASVTERLDDSPEAVVLESVLEGFSEYYSRNLAREVMKGLKETALQCKHTGGKPALGYDVDASGHYVINEREADAVRHIYKAYLRGDGYSKIIDWLKENAIKSKQGRSIASSSLHDILKNEKYTGTFVYNRIPARDARGKRNSRERKDATEIIRVEGGVPAIIDQETYDAAMDKMKKNRSGKHRAKEPYLLSGLLYCGLCGGAFVGSSRGKPRSATESPNNYYECGTRKRTRECNAPVINRDYIEDAVITYLEKLLNAKIVDEISTWVTDNIKVYRKKADEEMKIVRKNLTKTTREANVILDKIIDGMDSDLARKRLATAEEQKLRLEAKLSDMLRISDASSIIDKKGIRLYLLQLKGIRSMSRAEQKKIIARFIESIKIYPPNNEGEKELQVKTKLDKLFNVARIDNALLLRHQ